MEVDSNFPFDEQPQSQFCNDGDPAPVSSLLLSGEENAADSNQASISILNDDCLIEVFKYLPPMDLSTMGSTCTRFKELSRRTYNLYSKTECLCIETTFFNCDLGRILGLLRNFGDMVSHLKINFYNKKFRRVIIDYVVQYCAGTLASFSLKCCVCLDRKVIVDAILQLSNLKELQLEECDDKCNVDYKYQRELVQVPPSQKMELSEDDDSLRMNLPNLTSLSIGFSMSNNLEFDRSILSDFVKRHPTLKEMSINSLSFLHPSVVGELADLHTLSIYNCDADIMPLAKLQNLHTLKINYFRRPTRDLLQYFACMEHLQELHLYAWVFLDDQDSFYSGLRSLRNLKVLVLHGCHGINFYMRFLHSLRHLRELKVSIRDLDEITQESVVELVSNLMELRNFSLYYIPQLFIYREATIGFTRSTYQRISEVCERREHKLIIKNYSDEGDDDETEEYGYGRISAPYECKHETGPVRYYHMERRRYRYVLNI